MVAKNKLQDVFGVSRDLPLTYTEREEVDRKFTVELGRDKHIVIYGSSKQGKTSLRKHLLKPNDCIVVQCSHKTTRVDIYRTILREAGVRVLSESSDGKNETVHGKITASGEIGIKLFAKLASEATAEGEAGSTKEKKYREIEIELSSVNDVVSVLNAIELKKFIVIEDFHYLDEQVQKEIAVDLKAVHEKSRLIFMIVGVWLEANHLVLYNGDLLGRVSSIEAERWTDAQLVEVMKKGEELLNFSFTPEVKHELLRGSAGNVGILQELCFRTLDKLGIHETGKKQIVVDNVRIVQSELEKFVDESSARYATFIGSFAQGIRDRELHLYKWIMAAVLNADTEHLRKGLEVNYLDAQINKMHPTHSGRVYSHYITGALEKIAQLQQSIQVQPMVLSYNAQQKKLQIVDQGFFLYLQTADRKELLKLLPEYEEEKVGPQKS